MIFDYLSTYEILHGFLQISSYLKRVITTYNKYQLNFCSIIKSQFDFICHHIDCNNVVSLTISDGADTPGQSTFFLSLFNLEQFYTTLRSLLLMNLNENSLRLRSIIERVHMFTHLL